MRENRRDLPWLVLAAVLFGALDLAVHGAGPPTTGWAGPHAGLLLHLSVDASLLLLARHPVPVACWALTVAALALGSAELAPGLLTPVDPATRAVLPHATPAIVVNLVRLTDRRRAFALIGALAVLGTSPWDPSWESTPLGVVNTVLPALAALYLRARRELVDSLRERAERAERERLLLAERAAARERRRLAEEMHDVVTHRLTLVVLHAGALGVGSTDPAARAAAEDIRLAGVGALAELRDLLGVLRGADGTPVGGSPVGGQPVGGPARPACPERPPAPDPRALVAEARAVGESVSCHVDGDPGRIEPTVLRTAYRVVQESLTNARKHAPGAQVAVTISYRPDGVDVR
ncbi:sensor histidine kinase, partial [Actinosynnema sp.]|uniref:sensor histidine kinase n=1 Tax=Actinosynnema sp. TaxID=1872144 RepID=UPI003F82BA84